MSELEELYQEMIMDHNRNPRNFRNLENASHSSNGFNPFCGDSVDVYLKIENELVIDASFQGSGCAISQASASMMTESVKGKSISGAKAIFNAFHSMITRGPDGHFNPEGLDDLEVLSGVSEYPIRIKCATLSWHTLKAALDQQGKIVKTG